MINPSCRPTFHPLSFLSDLGHRQRVMEVGAVVSIGRSLRLGVTVSRSFVLQVSSVRSFLTSSTSGSTIGGPVGPSGSSSHCRTCPTAVLTVVRGLKSRTFLPTRRKDKGFRILLKRTPVGNGTLYVLSLQTFCMKVKSLRLYYVSVCIRESYKKNSFI